MMEGQRTSPQSAPVTAMCLSATDALLPASCSANHRSRGRSSRWQPPSATRRAERACPILSLPQLQRQTRRRLDLARSRLRRPHAPAPRGGRTTQPAPDSCNMQRSTSCTRQRLGPIPSLSRRNPLTSRSLASAPGSRLGLFVSIAIVPLRIKTTQSRALADRHGALIGVKTATHKLRCSY
jgi:hypothetical protein